jgi:hypothetical protein
VDEIMRTFEDKQRRTVGLPDFPWSVMQGAAGTSLFLLCCAEPANYAFPLYDI